MVDDWGNGYGRGLEEVEMVEYGEVEIVEDWVRWRW